MRRWTKQVRTTLRSRSGDEGDGSKSARPSSFRPPNEFVYRIISLERLFELFDSRQNVLVRPRLWDDPFENFVLRSRAVVAATGQEIAGGHGNVYGQCWTLQKASDAMWRIYSPNAHGVRLRSHPSVLVDGLARTRDQEWVDLEVFIGRVHYMRNQRLIDFAHELFEGTPTPDARVYAETLWVKRRAFEHEREVRLLIFPRDDHGDLFKYPVDPHAMVDQLMLDPRLSANDARALRQRIRAKTGFLGPILRSLLYAPPPEMVFTLR